MEFFGEDCCSTTFEAALLPSVRERQLCFLAAAFKIPKSGKQSKVSFYSLFSKQSPKPNSQLFLYLAGPLSDFNLSTIFILRRSSFRFQPLWYYYSRHYYKAWRALKSINYNFFTVKPLGLSHLSLSLALWSIYLTGNCMLQCIFHSLCKHRKISAFVSVLHAEIGVLKLCQ